MLSRKHLDIKRFASTSMWGKKGKQNASKLKQRITSTAYCASSAKKRFFTLCYSVSHCKHLVRFAKLQLEVQFWGKIETSEKYFSFEFQQNLYY